MEDLVPYKPEESEATPVIKESTREEKERARLAAYREKNKEKLAEKARARRAGKK